MADSRIMDIEEFDKAIAWQADHAGEAGAHCTARVIRALPKVQAASSELGRRMRNWPGLTLKDAMPLRVTGGLHHLALTGADLRLVPVYTGEITNQDEIDDRVLAMVADHDAALVPWLDGPPQTNEAGRSASIMGGLLWLAQRVAPRLELFELGASAGVNTMIERYQYRLGETESGPAKSPMQIAPEWRGESSPPAPNSDFAIVSVKGCDVAPIDLSDPDAALRLKSYVWPDAPARMQRIDAAIALARECGPDLIKQDAADFVKARLSASQSSGITRVMFHSIMWQYMPAASQTAIVSMMEEAGNNATPDKPLAWVSLETNPATFRHELRVRYWNGAEDGGEGNGRETLLAHAHPHGAWVEWTGNPE